MSWCLDTSNFLFLQLLVEGVFQIIDQPIDKDLVHVKVALKRSKLLLPGQYDSVLTEYLGDFF